MAFTVFPDAAVGPMSLGPGQTSAPLAFPESPAVFLRIVMLGDRCTPPDAPPPTFQVQADEGVPVDLPDDRAVFVYNRPEEASHPAATAHLFNEGEHVYAIRIDVHQAGSRWQLRITNNDDAERKFTWVVADNDPEAKQPWLNLPQAMSFDCEVSQEVSQSLAVCNHGTGFLTMSLGGLAIGSKFHVDQLPTDIAPNNHKILIITFVATNTAGTIDDVYTAETNDPRATDSAHNNKRIRLTASVSDPFIPDGGNFGACSECTCRGFTPPPAHLANHPVFGRRCRTVGCGHDMDEHRPPT